MKITRIEIINTIKDALGQNALNKNLEKFPQIKNITCTEVYTIEKNFTELEIEKTARKLINPVAETFFIDNPAITENFDFALEIGFLPGVTDNVGATVRETIQDALNIKFDYPNENVFSSRMYYISGNLTEEAVQNLAKNFANPLIQRISIKNFAKFSKDRGMDKIVPQVKLHKKPEVTEIDLNSMSDDELQILGKKGIKNTDGSFRGPLALDLKNMKHIREYFKKEKRNPRDIELEAIAQTWSEHCNHTIFANQIDDITKGLYSHYIKRATKEIRERKGKNDFCRSVFRDNSGAIKFNDEWDITDKAETHNSPSALDPFGGAITGIVGVNRDSLGYGLGAKPIANRYGFCFGNPDKDYEIFREKTKEGELKNPALTPREIMDGVIAGVEEGGNQSGIPTPTGWVYFHDRYCGKPLIFVGTVGLIPRKINSRNSNEKCAQAGDAIVVAGGRVGADGIHGATFSSEGMDESSPATAVQIGDPITQKKLSDAIIREIRGQNLYSSITDNGAGGISCSVAEMAEECGGCCVELEKVPLKYPNLDPWEIWISESQERMTFSVPQKNLPKFREILDKHDVEMAVIGKFTDSGRCQVNYESKNIMDIDMDFLHNGWIREKLVTKKPAVETNYDTENVGTHCNTKNVETNCNTKNVETYRNTKNVETYRNTSLQEKISRKNTCGYEFISKQYDHEVQANSVIKPLQGNVSSVESRFNRNKSL